jgi:hypothetical protein
MPIALLLIGGILIYSFANQAKAVYEQVQYSPQKLKVKRWGVFNTEIDLFFGITNNTTAQASVQSIDGLLKTKDSTLGTFAVRNSFTIAPQATTTVVSRLTLNNYDALKAIFQIIKNGTTPEIIFDGAITTNLFGRIPYKYTALLSQDLSFKNAKAAETKLTGIGSVTSAELDNVVKRIKQNTHHNNHTEATLVLANFLGQESDANKLYQILIDQNNRGYITSTESEDRNSISKRLLQIARFKYGVSTFNKLKSAF